MFTKKSLLLIPALFLLSPTLFSCGHVDPNVTYLKVLNSEDYIADGIIEDFEKEQAEAGRQVKVIYETFDTMENMFNTLKTGKTKYDLVCASDYMVQKLVNNDPSLLDPINLDKIPNYKNYASPFIRTRLQEVKWGEGKTLDQYAVGYMWGTLGIMYNPKFDVFKSRDLSEQNVIDAMKSYNALWDNRFQRTISVKDSMRDTYAIGLIHSHHDFFMDESKTLEERQKVFDYGGEDDENAKEHVNLIKDDLLKLRSNIFGFEVDSGKEDIVTEKIGVDVAWSGDAVRALNNAYEEKQMKLRYSIPEEGSNLWFDCWTLQKDANQELAYAFLDYLSRPDIAIKNIKKIGYTSAIGGSTVFDYYNDLYKTDGDGEPYNLSYFFDPNHEGDDYVINANPDFIGRQLTAQFPTKKEADHLMVMKDYGRNNDLILKMWEQVKHDPLPAWAIALFVIEIAAVAAGLSFLIVRNVKDKNRRKRRRAKTVSTN